MPVFTDLVGQRFGRLQVKSREPGLRHKSSLWRCACDCGSETVVTASCLKGGRTSSCGCLQKELTSKRSRTHGESSSRIYKIRQGMLSRCYNEKTPNFKDYGLRGIGVCKEWRSSYESFRDWALSNGYEDGLTLDRINNQGNYEPSNCQWITPAEQNRNRRTNVKYKGKCIAEWIRELGLKKTAVETRLKRHWPIEKALFTPVQEKKRKETESASIS